MKQHFRSINRTQTRLSLLSTAVLLVTAMVPMSVQAAQLNNRQLELESSVAGATTGHNFSFDIATAADVGGFRFEYCANDPFPGETCTAPSGFDATNFTLDAQTGASGFSKDGTETSTNVIAVSNGTPQSFAVDDTVTFDFSSVVNPDTANQEYFVRLYTYDDDAYTTVIDDGGLAFSTAETVEVTARVQETLSFCVYTGADCASGGTQADLGILSTGTTEVAESYFDVATNARSGVSIVYYSDATLTSDAFTIDAFSGGDGTLATSTTGTEQFGLRVSDVTTGGQNAVASAPFDTAAADEYAFHEAAYDDIGESSGPVETTTFTIEYAANVDSLTETGIYDTQVEYIATGTF